MVWNVFYIDFNTGEIRVTNVLRGREDFIRTLKSKSASKEEFSKGLRSEMMYHYWSRAEWEVLISPWCGRDNVPKSKVDVFWQLQLNWERFVDYCWDYKN